MTTQYHKLSHLVAKMRYYQKLYAESRDSLSHRAMLLSEKAVDKELAQITPPPQGVQTSLF